MSEERTRDLSDNRSFEERVFVRFDSIDGRFDAMFLRLDAIEPRFDAIDARFDATDARVDARFAAVDARFDAVDARFDTVDARLDSLDVRVQNLESRALDTKPIWERALAEILEVKEGVEDLQRKFKLLTEDVMQVRADQIRVERRMDNLESRP
jgi:chromosome segregation ATPase